MCGVAVVSKAKANEQEAAAKLVAAREEEYGASGGDRTGGEGGATIAARRTSVDIGTEGGAVAILNLSPGPGAGGAKAGAYRDLEMESVDEEGRASFANHR